MDNASTNKKRKVSLMQVKTPKVSVCVVTYNHEKYIRQCLQSIVDQKTDFDFEVIVGDDCSTDETRAIVQEFVDKYPDIINPIFHEKNIGATKNYFSIHQMAQGEYVAHVDGDDYVYPGKLAYQYKILSKDDSLTVCGHRVDRFNDEHVFYESGKPQQNIFTRFTLTDAIIYGPLFAHSSYMYKKYAQLPYDQSSNLVIVDYHVLMHYMLFGDAVFIHEPLGAYRINNEGISYKNEHKISLLYLDAYLNIFTNTPHHGSILLNAAIVNALSIIKHKKLIPIQILKMFYQVKRIPNIKKIYQIRKERQKYHQTTQIN